MTIKGIHHNVYRCRDTEETRRFYEGFLGLPMVMAKEFASGGGLHTFFQLGNDSFLAFMEVPAKPFEFKEQDELDLHIALEIADAEVEPWLEKARASGLTRDGITDRGVLRSIYLRDPNGYVIELVARASIHDRLIDPSRARRDLDRWQAAKEGFTRSAVASHPVEMLGSPA
jgi:catechol 2,3-dioxygenase-like lactoylglutathione lyase family enzyme